MIVKGLKIIRPNILALAMLTFFDLSFAQSSEENLVKEIVSLRSEIEQLNSQIDEIKARIRAESRNAQMRKSELALSYDRESLRVREFKSELDKKKRQLAEKSSKNTDLIPVVLEGIGILEKYVNSSLPFKKQDRLSQLSQLRKEVQEGNILPEKALNQLWAIYEDEIRATKESGIYKDTVYIDNKPYLADVLRVGMVGLLFRTGDRKYGFLKAPEYKIHLLSSGKDQKMIDNMFDSFKKQIRTGYFVVPNFLPGEVRK
ncbi:MAG: DUF3450 domain-containing protein [Hydrogenothermaceae bacterium]|nr:DUF3450 domain-containing protein [Hydrogenothermaceae bacterium]